jgi:hypothetical protein
MCILLWLISGSCYHGHMIFSLDWKGFWVSKVFKQEGIVVFTVDGQKVSVRMGLHLLWLFPWLPMLPKMHLWIAKYLLLKSSWDALTRAWPEAGSLIRDHLQGSRVKYLFLQFCKDQFIKGSKTGCPELYQLLEIRLQLDDTESNKKLLWKLFIYLSQKLCLLLTIEAGILTKLSVWISSTISVEAA